MVSKSSNILTLRLTTNLLTSCLSRFNSDNRGARKFCNMSICCPQVANTSFYRSYGESYLKKWEENVSFVELMNCYLAWCSTVSNYLLLLNPIYPCLSTLQMSYSISLSWSIRNFLSGWLNLSCETWKKTRTRVLKLLKMTKKRKIFSIADGANSTP